MSGLGTVVNALAIIGGACVGLLLKRGFPPKWQDTIMQGIALCIVIIGTQLALASKNIILVIVSLVLGTLVGEAANIDGLLHLFGDWVEHKLVEKKTAVHGEARSQSEAQEAENGSKPDAQKNAAGAQDGGKQGSLGEAFIATSLIYCVGAMAIVGSIQDGLTGDHSVLFAKATLDGLTAIIFSANMGAGVALSSVPVFLYQGGITLLASTLQGVMTQPLITEVSATGGILIMAIGINMLKLLNIRIANQIPSILVAGVLAKIFM